MKRVAIIQARMSSTRLPGKVLADLGGIPLIAFMLERVARARSIDQIIVATTTDAADDELAREVGRRGVECYRGDPHDVLRRYRLAAERADADIVVRLTGDCPLIDVDVIDAVLLRLTEKGLAYASNVDPPSFPDGLDVEAFTRAALDAADRGASAGSDREHVTPFIRRHKSHFPQANVRSAHDLSALRWTVDHPDDLAFVRAVLARFSAPEAIRADRFDFLRAIELDRVRLPANAHGRNESYSAPAQAIAMKCFSKSTEFLARAERVIPLGSQTFSKSRTQYPRGVSPHFIHRAAGSRVWDLDGNEYIDFVSALASVTLGYQDPDVTRAVQEQLKSGVIFSLPHPLETEVAELICAMVPCADMVRFGKNGSDATAGAVRLARAFTGREHIAVCGYHGWQDWYIGSTARHRGVPLAVRDLTHTFAYNDLDSLEQVLTAHPRGVAAVVLEPMNVAHPLPGFLEGAKALAHAHGALLVFDETITGFRFANGGAQSLFGVHPDLATFGKGLANGYPLSAVAGRRDVMELMQEVFFSFTFGGETLSLAAAKATLEKLRALPILETIAARGTRLMKTCASIIDANGLTDVFSVAGHPSWSFLTCADARGHGSYEIKTLLMQELHQRGILSLGSHNLSFAHSEQDIDALGAAYAELLPWIGTQLTSGTLRASLRCEPLIPLFRVR